jgi:hypothetical protein
LGLVGLYAEREKDSMKKSDEFWRKIAELMKLAEQYGDKSQGIVPRKYRLCRGGSRPETKSVHDDTPAASPKPSVN